MYSNIPGRHKIGRKEYTITDEDLEDTLIEDSNWSTLIHPGMQLSLNMIVPATSTTNFQNCPRCREVTFGHKLPQQRRRW